MELVARSFVVDVPCEIAWDHLAQVECWPSWAKHIKRVTMHPAGPVTETSSGSLHLVGGIRSTFRMEAFEPPNRWQWVGRFLTTLVHYDHRFEPVDPQRTRLVWTVIAQGPGSGSLGRLFGVLYARNLDRAIPRLQAELKKDH